MVGVGLGGLDHLDVQLLDEGEFDIIVILRHIPVLGPEVFLKILGLETIAVLGENRVAHDPKRGLLVPAQSGLGQQQGGGEVKAALIRIAGHKSVWRLFRALEKAIFVKTSLIDIEAFQSGYHLEISLHPSVGDLDNAIYHVVECLDLIGALSAFHHHRHVIHSHQIAPGFGSIYALDLRNPALDVVEPAVVRSQHENIVQRGGSVIDA